MMPPEYDITGKVVFITGAGRGIGKGIAQVLAEAGADVALNALTPKYVVGTAAAIAAASGRRVMPIIADVTKSDDVRRAVESALSAFGRIDVLVNALGDSIRKPLVALPGQEGDSAAISDDDLKFIMDINLTEALLCTRAVGPHMLARRSGRLSISPRGPRIRAARIGSSTQPPRPRSPALRGRRRLNGRPSACTLTPLRRAFFRTP